MANVDVSTPPVYQNGVLHQDTPGSNPEILGSSKAQVPTDVPEGITASDAAPIEKLLQELNVGGLNKTSFRLEDRYIDEPRPLKVAVIGGGIAGITAGILLPAKVPEIQLTIFEKNSDLGGTWFENVYPGVRCDIPSLTYQSTFAPNSNWSDKFAPGSEIRDYWQGLARQFNVYQHTKLSHKVDELVWDDKESVWVINVKNLGNGEAFSEKFDFVLTAIGRFNAWRLPNYPGISEYRGILRHASHWDPSFDPTGKTVAVIGNGASGIQLTANLQKTVSRLDHYARNPTWIAASFSGDERTLEPQPFSEEEKKAFQDPETYLKLRKSVESKYWRTFNNFVSGSKESNESREQLISIMKKRLAKKPELLEQLVPDFSPFCRRLTPGPGYLEALTEDNVELIRSPIKRFTETGIETTDGVHREVDAIFCATGANVDMTPPFSIRANGLDLKTAWLPSGEFGFAYSYLGLATPGFPNLFFIHGPHPSGPTGSVPHSQENQISYYAKVLRKASREGIKSIVPSKKAADDFTEYAKALFSTTVFAENCSSWYNGAAPGGYIHGLWPGSGNHCTIVRREPRWEDWEYEYLSTSGNRFAWYFGNGQTRKENGSESDPTPYLQLPSQIDLRDVHESWWSIP